MVPASKVSTAVRWLRGLAWAEGLSLLALLFVTMPLKYGLDIPGPNKVLGLVHGLLTVIFVSFLCYQWASRRWPVRILLWGFAASLVPFAVIYVERRVFVGLDAMGVGQTT